MHALAHLLSGLVDGLLVVYVLHLQRQLREQQVVNDARYEAHLETHVGLAAADRIDRERGR